MVESIGLEDIYFEIKLLRKEIEELKKEDLSIFVDNLKKQNQLATNSEAKKVGIEI